MSERSRNQQVPLGPQCLPTDTLAMSAGLVSDPTQALQGLSVVT